MTALACFTALEEVPRLLVAREDLRDLMEYTLLLLTSEDIQMTVNISAVSVYSV